MRALLMMGVAAAVGCAHPAPLVPRTASSPEVRQLDAGRGTNVFVVMGARPILVDTGWGMASSTEKVVRALRQIAVEPRDLALIVLTHGHGDHAGGAKRLRELSGARVVAGAGDVAMLAAGHNRPLRATGFFAKLVRGYSDQPFPPFAPDVALSARLDLAPYGVDGTVEPVPGHTPGSLAVLLPNGDAVVGDLARGSLWNAHWPRRHFFHDDCRAAEAELARLLDLGVRRLYVGHGGPLDAAATRRFLARGPCER